MDSQDVAVTAIIIIIIIIINLSLYIKERRVSLFSFRLYFCVSLSIRKKKQQKKKSTEHCACSLVLHNRGATQRKFLPSRQSNALLSLLGQLEFKSLCPLVEQVMSQPDVMFLPQKTNKKKISCYNLPVKHIDAMCIDFNLIACCTFPHPPFFGQVR